MPLGFFYDSDILIGKSERRRHEEAGGSAWLLSSAKPSEPMDEETVDIDEVIRSACRTVLEEDGEPLEYQPEMVVTWTQDLIELILSTLSSEADRHKKRYICHVVLVQSVGAGVHCNTGHIWNADLDSYHMLPYATGTMNVVCTVYSLPNVEPPSLQMPTPN